MVDDLSTADRSDECAIPIVIKKYRASFVLPECSHADFTTVTQDYKELFRCASGRLQLLYTIFQPMAPLWCSTTMNPSTLQGTGWGADPGNVKARNYWREQQSLDDTSSSRTKEIRCRLSWIEQTMKDASPLPLPDEVQDQIATSTFFHTESPEWVLANASWYCYDDCILSWARHEFIPIKSMPFGLTCTKFIPEIVEQGLPWSQSLPTLMMYLCIRLVWRKTRSIYGWYLVILDWPCLRGC